MLKIEVVDQWSDFLNMEENWNLLLTQSPQRDNIFLTHEWFRAWWEAFGAGKELMIVLVKSENRLIGIAPLMRFWTSYYGLPIRLLSLITNDHTNRADFIFVEHQREGARLVLDFMARQIGRWDMAELNFLPANSSTVEAIGDLAGQCGFVCSTKPSYQSPYIILSESWNCFYSERDGHFRRNLKNREKRLLSLGVVEYEENPEGRDSLSSFLEEMFAVGSQSWKETEKTAIASTPSLRRFYTRLAELMHPKGLLSLHLLRVDGKPVAFQYALAHNGALYLLKTEYDIAYHPYSPGHQIQKRVLQSCFARGLQEFDFLGPNMPWKQEWAELGRDHVRLLLFHRGLQSRILALLELWAKPTLKRSPLVQRLWRGSPPAARQDRREDECN
jgi:CelD/BcsL family acetyltransferase involved in cellulose biosynthesis